MEKAKRILKYVLGVILVGVVLHQILTYTIPVKLKPFPIVESYDIENPFTEHTIDDNDIKSLAAYLEQTPFKRVRPPQEGCAGYGTIYIYLRLEGTHAIQVFYTVLYPTFSCVEYDDKWYRLDKEDRAFLHNLIFDDKEE